MSGLKLTRHNISSGENADIPVVYGTRGFFFISSVGTSKTCIFAVGANNSGVCAATKLAESTSGAGVVVTPGTNAINVNNNGVGAMISVLYLSTT